MTFIFYLISIMSGGQSIWYQKEVSLPSKKRGCHLVTEDIERNVPELQLIKIGLAHVPVSYTHLTLPTIVGV